MEEEERQKMVHPLPTDKEKKTGVTGYTVESILIILLAIALLIFKLIFS